MWKAIGANKNSEPSGVWRISKWGNYSRSVRFNQLEKEKLNLQKRIQEVENLIGDEKEILLKKNIPVDQMIEFMGFEKLTPEVLQKYVKAIYMHDDGRIEMCWKELK